MRVSVSSLDLFRSWREQEDQDFNWLLKALTDPTPTPAMLRGRAFAIAMEQVQAGAEFDQITVDGFTFCFTGEFTIESWPRREEKREKDYGGIVVSARCDRVLGKTIIDDKNTERFDAENYLEKYQSRFYLDMFEADKFIWNVWEVKEMDEPDRTDQGYDPQMAIIPLLHNRSSQKPFAFTPFINLFNIATRRWGPIVGN